MGLASPFEKEKLLCGCLYTDEAMLQSVREALEALFGAIDFVSAPYDFSEISPYYDGEMHGDVRRVFFSFRELVDPAELAMIKIKTNELEARFADSDGRLVNLDPGLMGPGKLILATTKPAAHRIALRDGIYAELTLFYARGDFQNLPWTYIDFRLPAVKAILREIRRGYMAERRSKNQSRDRKKQ